MKTEFKKHLKEIRISKNFTQLQMAESLFMDQSTYSRLENGIKLPDTDLIDRINCLYDVSICLDTNHFEDPGNTEEGKNFNEVRISKQIFDFIVEQQNLLEGFQKIIINIINKNCNSNDTFL